ncbi:MAG TPA: glutamate--cysteine ligase [Pseudomonadaceae bacterium]|nr:glutamate--cysteine ligase [Pseudomonadaceae bacterium]
MHQKLQALAAAKGISCLANISHGIEKESLRVDPEGHLALSVHPQSLGSALTHPCITTDFSEAQLEFITPVYHQPADSLRCLEEIHTWTYMQMSREELLWTSSMPCIIGEDHEIPLAYYGSSNIGQLKTLYRKGLGYRYGRTMQTISGIHYNFSVCDDFWQLFRDQREPGSELQDFKTRQYLALIRNFRRHSWLLLYLFGASPALCKSFVSSNHEHGLEEFDEHSLYAPFGTSLRMGDLGYTSEAQRDLYISYNTLEEYAQGLLDAIQIPYAPYDNFHTEDGSPAQLSTSILQIENEFYSTVRPKRVTSGGIRPVRMLREKGVEYVEVRLLDLNPFLAVGIDEEQMRFLNAFLLFCLLRESPPGNRDEDNEIHANLQAVVRQGRDPALDLQCQGESVKLRGWAAAALREVQQVATLLDQVSNTSVHVAATAAQEAKVDDAALTPSARVLQRMRELKTGYFRFAMNQSLANSDYFRAKSLSAERLEEFRKMTTQSVSDQQTMEAADILGFPAYLAQINNS